jgi:hypothetical protein
MLCAHCYQERLGITKKTLGRKGNGQPLAGKPISAEPRPS